MSAFLIGITLKVNSKEKPMPNDQSKNTPVSVDSSNKNNPLIKDWTGPYGGLPPFDKVKVNQFKPALTTAMMANLQEISAIVKTPAPANFDNTIAAMERTGRMLERVQTVYGIWSSNMSSDDFQKVEAEMEPQMAAFYDQIMQNSDLFRRIETVYNSPEYKTLTPEQQRLTWTYYTNFIRAGARLDDAAKTRLSEINQQLATFYTQFSQNQLADESGKYLVLSKEDMEGISASGKDAAAAAATKKKQEGKYVITNTRSSIDPFLTYAENRSIREKAWRMFISRGDNGDEHDNNKIISDILKLRRERAQLLGYPTHAHWRMENTMAKNPDAAMDLMLKVWEPAVARVKQEVADMQAVADAEKAGITIEPWDYRYYAEKVRKAKYDLDQNQLKPYLQLEKLREGMFWVAGQLFGLEFAPLQNIPVYHPDVRVYEVKEKGTGKHVGLWYFDPYAREGKRSGAWMNAYRNQYRLDGKEVTTIVSNNANFIKGKEGEAVLISWDDAETLFHEFGHALHGLCSNVNYPSLSGTNVYRDFVEFPSQLLEHWLSTPEVLEKYAVHYKTGQPIPADLVKKIEKASTFNEGYKTVEYLSSAILDLKIHLSTDENINAKKFELDELNQIGMPKEMVMRHRLPQFGHIFSSDAYSAGYYSYLWADVITADAFEAFTEAKGPYDKDVAAKLKRYIFSTGNTMDPAEEYKLYRGRDPKVEALMRKRGF